MFHCNSMINPENPEERILKNTEHGLITTNEGMKALCDPIDGIVL